MAVRLGLVGRGRWGRNIERTLASFPDVSLAIIGRDERPQRGLDGVLIATPSATHADVALPYIRDGIATFIEKPMATSLADAERIGEAAGRSGAAVFVGHIHLHNPAFTALLGALPEVGAIRYALCEGMNERARADSSVLWDWLPHHLSMARAIFGRDAAGVTAWRLAGRPTTEAAVCRFMFGDVPLLSLLSWYSPARRQCVTIAGERGTIVFDDKAERRLAVHGAGGAISHPKYDDELPLTRQMRAFLAMVRSGKTDRSQIDLGIAVVRMVGAAEASIAADGIAVPI